MKKVVFILIVSVAISLTVNTALSIDIDPNESISTDNQVKISAETISENHEIKESFYKTADLEYDEKKCNCKHKSEAFADVLVKNGAHNVYLIIIEHESHECSHMVVSWNGKIYDATMKPPVYGISEYKYFNMVKRHGLTGLRYKSPYKSK